MVCPICKSNKARLTYENYPGYFYVNYNIYGCINCNTSFIDTSKLDPSIYEKIYSELQSNESKIAGYERYLDYASEIKNSKDPIMFLTQNEDTYFPIYEFVKDKHSLKILEIGCGLGYLTYSLKSLGHDVTGIDVSSNAIEFASKQFGDYFLNADLLDDSFRLEGPFDLIIGNEVIEHLPEVRNFIIKCKTMLKEGGSMIFTTPNKDHFKNSSNVWATDNPPVHTFWFSKKSFEHLAQENSLKMYVLESFNKYTKNNLLSYLYSMHLLKNSSPGWSPNSNKSDNFIKNFIYRVSNLYFFRVISNFIYRLICKEPIALFVRLEK